MRTINGAMVVAAAMTFAVHAAPCTAQSQRVTTSIREIRDHGNASTAVHVLRQVERPIALSTRRELADSLLSFVLENQNLSSQHERVQAVINALGASVLQQGAGSPDTEALRALTRVADVDGPNVSKVLFLISSASDRAAAVRHLSAHAKLDRSSAGSAIELLTLRLGSEGSDAVRELWRTSQIRDSRARTRADEIARERAWQ